MATAHNSAEIGQIAKVVLMPGDPLRAKFIADTFLEDVVCFNTVRGMNGYTGKYKGHEVSVMGHGMGMASIGIYSYELYAFYGVESIIRVGSSGGMVESLDLGDVVVALGACTDSNYGAQYALPGTFAPIADFGLVKTATDVADKLGHKYVVGNVLSSDVFYMPEGKAKNEKWASMGVYCVEMECAALYMNAAYLGKKAMGLLTISDMLVGECKEMTSEERQTKFTSMMTIALETAILS